MQYHQIKKDIEALPNVQGIFYRFFEKEVQYFIAIDNYNVFKELIAILPEGWRIDALGKNHSFCISYPLQEEDIYKELEKNIFP